MDSRSSGRVSVLPVEMQHHILGFCDRATLAVTSRVSLAFLELSAPLLYADIELIGLHRVEELFCHREPTNQSSAQLAPLSLRYINSLTIVATYTTGGELNLSTARLTSPSLALSVGLLVLRPIGINPCDTDDYEDEIERWTEILKIVDPVHVRVSGLPPGQYNVGQIPEIDLFHSSWPSLETLTLTNIDLSGFLGDSLLVQEDEGTAVVVVLDLSDRISNDAYEHRLRFNMSFQLHPEAFPERVGRISEFVVRIRSKEEKDKFEGDMRSFWSRETSDRTDEFARHVRFDVLPSISAPTPET